MSYTRREAATRFVSGAVALALSDALVAADAATRPTSSAPADVVAAAAKTVQEQYFNPLLAQQTSNLLLAKLRSGRYRTLTAAQLAKQVTEDLRSLTHDLHLELVYEPATPTSDTTAQVPEDELPPRTTNYGVQTVARLQGNIGLLRITHFPSPPYRFDNRYGAAFELLRDTEALILDLTINHGGGEDTMGFFLSYLIDGDVEFGRFKYRHDPDVIVKTSKEITGRPFGEKRPLFVAISRDTFSAGEAVASHLRQFRHGSPAVLVGERTKGGAHSGDFFPLPHNFRVFVPKGRSEGPDWEGTGVSPDVAAAPSDAVRLAHRLALQQLLDNSIDPTQRAILRNVTANCIENLSSFAFEKGASAA